ncbi:MAG: hypothetical protein AAF081_07440 [Actinomycetota bacterium]
MSRFSTATLRAVVLVATNLVVFALAAGAAAQDSDGGAFVPSEPSERGLTGSYVVAAVVVAAVLALFVAQAVRNRRSDDEPTA